MARAEDRSRSGRIYLCTLDELVGSANDERAAEQMALLASILGKLGYQLMSGEAPRFHELWAARIEAEPTGFFERQFLAWLHVSLGVLPVPQQGDANAEWTFRYRNSDVAFVIAGQDASSVDWILQIEEAEPAEFIDLVETHFSSDSGTGHVTPRGTIRVQFESSALIQPFIDQSEST